MADFFLGIDYGTGGAKACVIDLEGTVLGFAFREYPSIHEKPGWSEHEPLLYWQVCCALIREALAEAGATTGFQVRDVGGIAVSSALPSLVMVDRDHQPVERAYNLMDRRAIREVQWLKETCGEERLFQLTGNRLEDHPTIVNLLWERRNRPQSFERVDKALTIDGYITLKLTGRAVLNKSAASFYGVGYDLRRLEFDLNVLKEIGIDPDLMPSLYRCDEIVGEVTVQAAEETGLVAGIPVAAGQVDCNAGYLGAGAVDEGDIQCNLGTVGNFGLLYRDRAFAFSETGFQVGINFPYTADCENTLITVPTTMTGGQSIRYLRDQFGQDEVEAGRVLGVSAYDLLNLEAAKVPVGSEGLIVLPFLMGERTPIWDALSRCVVFGLSLNHTKGHLVRAMMEGVAYAMYDSFRLVQESGLKVSLPLVMNEGGAISVMWRQIIADVFDVPIVLVKRRTGAPFGDAILAGVAAGLLPGFEIAQEWAEYVEPIEPDAENHERYMEYHRLYRRLYQHLADDFHELARIRAQV